MHEHMKNFPKYMLKFPLGANTNTNNHNRTQPNKKIKRFDMEMKFSQLLSK